MSTLTTIQSTDLITNSRADINDNFSALNTDKMETSVLDTDTTLAANSDAKIPSQKAVKAYVDAGGNVNASETTKGIVEEATDAEIVAGTDTGGTGAKLFVPPSKLNTQIDAKIASIPTLFQQSIPALTANFNGFGTDSTGTVFYTIRGSQGALKRYEKDTVSKIYLETHSIAPAITGSTFNDGMFVLGSYLYVFHTQSGSNLKCMRYLAADLTGETVMTVPAVSSTGEVNAWTDGTFAYIVTSFAPTTSRKWSLSGTTWSAVSTATVTTGIFSNANSCSVWNGTSAYLLDNSISTTGVTIRKITTIDGTAYTTTTKNLAVIGGADTGVAGIPIGTTALYIGKISNNFNATVDVSSTIHLFPITAP